MDALVFAHCMCMQGIHTFLQSDVKESLMKQLSKLAAVLATAAIAFGVQAQTSGGSSSGGGMSAEPGAAAPAAKPAKSAMGQGQVTKVDAATGSITLKTGETLKVQDPSMLKGVKEGSQVEFKADMTADGAVITALRTAK
jgi:Cu/Ag efflux protein CusF